MNFLHKFNIVNLFYRNRKYIGLLKRSLIFLVKKSEEEYSVMEEMKA